jgi:DegV family protein with EDD domain
MSGVAVVTDTTHYLPRELVEANDIREVSLYVNWPDSQERESAMGTFDAFYERLRGARELPTTSQPSVGDFLAVYEPLLDAGQDIVSIHLSGGISGTVESARQAAAQCPPGRVQVLDSTTACGGLGLMTLAAAKGAREGIGIEACLDRARQARERLTLWFAIDTCARRRGRSRGWPRCCAPCTATASTAGSSSTSRRPTRPPAWPMSAARSSAQSPSSSRRSGP